MTKKKTYRRELIEWTVLLAIGATLYFTGYHTEVIGQIQRLVLATGIIQPDLEVEKLPTADYGFILVDTAGQQTPFSELEGKTVFVNFWATWCPPCIAEMPDIQELYSKERGNVSFVMISLDEDPEKARRFIRRKGYTFPVYFLASPLPRVYNPSTIPTTYVISPEGSIVMSRQGMAKYNTEQFREFLRTVTKGEMSQP